MRYLLYRVLRVGSAIKSRLKDTRLKVLLLKSSSAASSNYSVDRVTSAAGPHAVAAQLSRMVIYHR